MRPEVTGSCFSEADFARVQAEQIATMKRGYVLVRAVGIRADNLGPWAVFHLCCAIADDPVVAGRTAKISYTALWADALAVVKQMTDQERAALRARISK